LQRCVEVYTNNGFYGEGNGKALQYSYMTERLHFHFSLSHIGEGNGNPVQCSCLENPRDREAWWAAIYGAAQSRTRLKRLSSSSSSKARSKLNKIDSRATSRFREK